MYYSKPFSAILCAINISMARLAGLACLFFHPANISVVVPWLGFIYFVQERFLSIAFLGSCPISPFRTFPAQDGSDSPSDPNMSRIGRLLGGFVRMWMEMGTGSRGTKESKRTDTHALFFPLHGGSLPPHEGYIQHRKKGFLFSVSKSGRNAYVFFRADLDANSIMQEYFGGEQTFALASLWTQTKFEIFITCFPAQAYDNCQLDR